MRVVVIGTGYVGLTTATVLSYIGNSVTCLDINAEKISQLQQGILPIHEPHLDEVFEQVRHTMRFTTDYAEADLPNTEVIIIAVGTPSLPDGNADLVYLSQAAESLAQNLGEAFTLIVNKSTVPIGTGIWLEGRIQDHINALEDGAAKRDFNVISSPEFLSQGSALRDSFYPNRIIIGTQHAPSIERFSQLFEPIHKQNFEAPKCLPRPEGLREVPIFVCDMISAETIKYAANAFLATKISFINEMGYLAKKVGADVDAISKGLGLDPRIGSRFLNAGIGWGGSCFGKDTAALVATARKYDLEMSIVQAARDVNYGLRQWIVDALQEKLGDLNGCRVTLLGFSFKPNTDDLRDAPSIDISKELIKRGAIVTAHDPVALKNARLYYPDLGAIYEDDLNKALESPEAVLLLTEWQDYLHIDWQNMPQCVIIDGRNHLDHVRLRDLGFETIRFGS
ncbi:MAG TPA: UDP-glucose/GDP-mannose dehydrogenase family protein [Anaerolineaceae bacterium]|nr:UDP-glucose/GDP-mannose dehydrogenase family protein [Anaerolineaceae bacterium]